MYLLIKEMDCFEATRFEKYIEIIFKRFSFLLIFNHVLFLPTCNYHAQPSMFSYPLTPSSRQLNICSVQTYSEKNEALMSDLVLLIEFWQIRIETNLR